MVSCWNCWHELLCKPCLPPCHNIPPPSLTTSNIVVADTSITAIGALMVNLDISHSDPNELEAVLVRTRRDAGNAVQPAPEAAGKLSDQCV